MSVVLILVVVSVVMASAFLTAFVWAVRNGQYEDTCTPAMRVLLDDGEIRMKKKLPNTNSKPTGT
jgi:cbb3-type cytochrome oxidase maturation protein